MGTVVPWAMIFGGVVGGGEGILFNVLFFILDCFVVPTGVVV